MQAEVIQTDVGLSPQYEIRRNSILIGHAEISHLVPSMSPCNLELLDQHLSLMSDLSYQSQQAESGFLSRLLRLGAPMEQSYKVTRNTRSIGRIYPFKEQYRPGKRVACRAIELNCLHYTVYHVGHGKDGTNYPIYEGEHQIALVKKPTTVRNGYDTYGIVALDDDSLLLAVLFALYEDIREHTYNNLHAGPAVRVTASSTTNPYLLKRDDPDFEARAT